MSLDNLFGINAGWKVDPDHRQNRSSGPVITYKMTPEEIEAKYGKVKGRGVRPESEKKIAIQNTKNDESEVKVMKKMTKETVRKMAAEGMTSEQIAEQFVESYPQMKKSMLLAKVAMLMSDKPRRPRKVRSSVEAETKPAEIVEALKAEIEKAEKETPEPAVDNVNHPAHYTTGKFEVIDIIESVTNSMVMTPFEGFCIGNAVKYIARWKHKGGVEDLKKARWYLDRVIGA